MDKKLGVLDPTCDLVIRGALVVTDTTQDYVDVAIRGEKIAAVLAPGTPIDARRSVNATGKVLIPGCIDPHTHVWWHWEDQQTHDNFDSASKVALKSGTTTIIDFLQVPRTGDAIASVEPRMKEASSRSIVDFSFHPILTSAREEMLEAVGEFVAMGMSCFKMYTTYPESRVNDYEIWLLMQAIHEAGGLSGFHAESDDIVRGATDALIASNRTAIRYYPQSRPALSEDIAIGTVARFAEELDCSVYIYHIAGGFEAVRRARRGGVNVIAETCTHYLTLLRSLYDGPEAWRYVMSPPLVDELTQNELWRALANREIQSVASDHCSYEKEQKNYDKDSFLVPGGIPGIAARVPLLLSKGVNSGRISLQDFVYATSSGIARSLGIFPQKGTIAVGSDADLALIDLAAEWTLSDGDESSRFSPYAGISGEGRSVMTIRRGDVVWDGESFIGEPGSGAFVRQSISNASREIGSSRS